MIRFVIGLCVAFVAGTVLVAAAPACDAGYVSHVSHNHVEVTPVVVATFLPVTVAVPVAGVGYATPTVAAPAVAQPAAAQPATPAATAQQSDEIAKLRKEIAELKAAVSKPAATPPPAMPPAAAAPVVAAVNCASCHGSQYKEKGGGRHFYDDAGKLLATANVARMIKAAKEGTMPPGKPLTDDQYDSFVADLAK